MNGPMAMGGPMLGQEGRGTAPGQPGNGAGPSGGRLGHLGQLEQLRSAFEAVTGIIGRPHLAVIRERDGAELWVDLLGASEGARIPGHLIVLRFGDPPAAASTNPVTYFAGGIATAAPMGVPLWVWIAGGAALFLFLVMPAMKGGRRR